MEILDIHSHRVAPATVTALSAVELAAKYTSATDVPLEADHLFSIGIHPWDTATAISPETTAMLEGMASRPEVVAIGETGIDTLKGGPMFRQINIFRQHILLSEKIGKPLIIHDVKGHDIIIGQHTDLTPTQPWVIHGFRYKPTVAEMFTSRGIYLSFGPQQNAETVAACPADLILAETDDAPSVTIEAVLATLSTTLNRDATPLITTNSARFLHL